MKITAARTIVCSPGRIFVTLKIETDQGLYGIGDATLNGRELAVAAYLDDHFIPCLIGMDPRRIEDTWQYLYRGAYWRKGPVTMSAIAAVDTALWDIKAKMANMPLYQLLGGRSRKRVLVYGHANGADMTRPSMRSANISRSATRRSVRRPACRGSRTLTAWAAANCSTSRPTRRCPASPDEIPPSRWATPPSCSRSCARPTASTITCSTTATIAIARSRRPSLARPSSPTGCSGSRT